MTILFVTVAILDATLSILDVTVAVFDVIVDIMDVTVAIMYVTVARLVQLSLAKTQLKVCTTFCLQCHGDWEAHAIYLEQNILLPIHITLSVVQVDKLCLTCSVIV